MNCFGFDDSVDVQGTTQTFCILVEIERIEVKGLLCVAHPVPWTQVCLTRRA